MNAIIVQARMGSKRLKDKTLLPLAGKPMIYRIIERFKEGKKILKRLFLQYPKEKKMIKFQKFLKMKLLRYFGDQKIIWLRDIT